MKIKIACAAVALTVATAAFAATPAINIVNGGSDTGTFRQILNMVAENVDSTFIQANTPIVAAQSFDQENILTVWSSEWPGKGGDMPKVEVTKDNLVALMVYETLMCSREFSSFEEMQGKTVKLATWGSENAARYLAKLGAEKGINFEVVPYSGSGGIAKGYVGHDADTVFNITTREAAILEDTSTKCFAYSANGDLDFAFVDSLITLNATGEVTASMRDLVNELKPTAPFQETFKGLAIKVPTDETVDGLIKEFDTAVVNFTP
jgi:hypothetical protein